MGEKKYNFEDDQSVADLLGLLPRVEAPANFDARVRSRIAHERPSTGRAWLIPSAAAVSLCAVVLAAVAFVYLRGPDAQIANVAQPEIIPVTVSESPNPQFALSNDLAPPPSTTYNSEEPTRPVVAEKRDARPGPSKSPTDGGGFFDEALRPAEAPKVPVGMPTPGSTPEANVRPPGPVNKVSAREVLQLIGLDAEFRDGGWLVKRVSENSMAARSGVRDGDVVEAIDDTKIVGNTTFESGFNGRNLIVVRDGNRQTISIQNR